MKYKLRQEFTASKVVKYDTTRNLIYLQNGEVITLGGAQMNYVKHFNGDVYYIVTHGSPDMLLRKKVFENLFISDDLDVFSEGRYVDKVVKYDTTRSLNVFSQRQLDNLKELYVNKEVTFEFTLDNETYSPSGVVTDVIIQNRRVLANVKLNEPLLGSSFIKVGVFDLKLKEQ